MSGTDPRDPGAPGEGGDVEVDPHLSFTVATVWREERISCPHPHVLQSFLAGGLEGGAAEFVRFHLEESQCPYCNAVVEDLQTRDSEAKERKLGDLRDRLLRSTATELERTRASAGQGWTPQRGVAGGANPGSWPRGGVGTWPRAAAGNLGVGA